MDYYTNPSVVVSLVPFGNQSLRVFGNGEEVGKTSSPESRVSTGTGSANPVNDGPRSSPPPFHYPCCPKLPDKPLDRLIGRIVTTKEKNRERELFTFEEDNNNSRAQ